MLWYLGYRKNIPEHFFIAERTGRIQSQRMHFFVMPAKAGIQGFKKQRIFWTPVFTGVTNFL